jgi:membrane protein insertase Oxa1/YidC/SpoIIIJ
MWTSFVELIRMFIFGAAHACGGSLGAGIVAASVIARLALLPLTLHLARQTRAQKASPLGLVGLLVQLPLLGGLFAAVRGGLGARVRFLWVGNLAQPDELLIAVVTILGGAMMVSARPAGTAGTAATLVPLLVGAAATLLFVWSASSAVALSFGAGSLVSGLQSWLLARDGSRAIGA